MFPQITSQENSSNDLPILCVSEMDQLNETQIVKIVII